MTEKHKQKIAESIKGMKRGTPSKEHRRKLSEAGKRRPPPSTETRRKISEGLKGREVSLETRMKIALAKGGNEIYYSEDEDARDTRFRRKQSLEARIRDNHTCQKCGKRSTKGNEMQGHHIVPRNNWWRMEYYPLEWVETLCTDCHAASDNQKGVIKWPKEAEKSDQTTLDEFLNDKMKKK